MSLQPIMVKQKSAAPSKTPASNGLKFILKSEVKKATFEGKTVIAIRGEHDF